MVVEVTLETIGIAVGILGSVGAGASTVLVMFGNSKWATRKAVHDLANVATIQDARIGKIESRLDHLGEAIERLTRTNEDANHELRKHSDSLVAITGLLNIISDDWQVYRKRNGPLNPD